MGLDESEPHCTANKTKPHNETTERLLQTDFNGPPLDAGKIIQQARPQWR